MDFLHNPEEMTPEARLIELAVILAEGYHRIRRARLAQGPVDPDPAPDNRLDCPSPPKRPSAQRLTARDGEDAA